MKVSQKLLLDFLIKKKYDAKIQYETDQICFILKKAKIDFPIFLRIYETSHLLQLLAFMPCQIRDGSHSDLARLLHLINKELDMPGFGMDESSGVVFYRCMLPTPDKQIDEGTLESYLGAMELVCESVAPNVLALATGRTTYAEITQKKSRRSV